MDSQYLSSLQRLFLWTLRHWGATEGPAPHMLRTLRAIPAGPTLLGAADRLLGWHDRHGRGPRQLGVPSAQALTTFEGQLLAAPHCAQRYPRAFLRLWLADHFTAEGLIAAPRVLMPMADALEDLGPDALLPPTTVQFARYGSCTLEGVSAPPARFP